MVLISEKKRMVTTRVGLITGVNVNFNFEQNIGEAPTSVNANCIIPGATDTRLVQSYLKDSSDPDEARKRLLNSIPLRRLAEPKEIANAVLFLASDHAAYITGTSLAVDGGLLAQG